jgi:hypothetical protein
MEKALWRALRTLEEHGRLLREDPVRHLGDQYAERADDLEEDIEALRNLITRLA